MPGETPTRLSFTRQMRLSHARQFQRVYAARTSVTRGPLRVHACPSPDGRTRIGLSVPKRVGNNVVRNRVKRLLREAFRLNQRTILDSIGPELGLEIVVGVQPHDPGELEDYSRALVGATAALAATWRSRKR